VTTRGPAGVHENWWQQTGGRVLSLLVRPTAPPMWLGVLVAAATIATETVLVVALKSVSPMETFGVVYLLGALVVAIGWGSGLATVTAVISAFAFGYFRNWPQDSFDPRVLRNWVVIGVFLVVTLLANALAGLARSRAAEAVARRNDADAAARHQAALRRVATAVASGMAPSDVFSMVTTELAQILSTQNAALLRYEPDGSAVLLAACDEPGLPKMPVGEQFSLDGNSILKLVQRDGRATRIDCHDHVEGSAAARVRPLGLHSGVGAPIVVDGRLWGVAIVGSSRAAAFPPDTEERLTDFADLAAMAVANAQARSDLTASRARIVTAADDARRRIERDLHDGAQQRLVSLALKARMTEQSLPAGQDAIRAELADIVQASAMCPMSYARSHAASIPRSCPRVDSAPRCGRWHAAR
jgi:K+-sensing histidine kinase KdpD